MRANPATALAFAWILSCWSVSSLAAQPASDGAAPLKPQGPEIAGPWPKTVILDTREKAPYGQYLTTAQGHALYIFSRDKEGESRCLGPCLEAWPPAYTEGDPKIRKDLDLKKVGILKRGSRRQVTYDARPLYYYKLDGETTATTGQGVFSYGGDWYLVSPSGEPITQPRVGTTPPR